MNFSSRQQEVKLKMSTMCHAEFISASKTLNQVQGDINAIFNIFIEA
jgi:hypothetical protein